MDHDARLRNSPFATDRRLREFQAPARRAVSLTSLSKHECKFHRIRLLIFL